MSDQLFGVATEVGVVVVVVVGVGIGVGVGVGVAVGVVVIVKALAKVRAPWKMLVMTMSLVPAATEGTVILPTTRRWRQLSRYWLRLCR